MEYPLRRSGALSFPRCFTLSLRDSIDDTGEGRGTEHGGGGGVFLSFFRIPHMTRMAMEKMARVAMIAMMEAESMWGRLIRQEKG